MFYAGRFARCGLCPLRPKSGESDLVALVRNGSTIEFREEGLLLLRSGYV